METVTAHEIAKRREAQITRLRKRLSGDLDNVILMSMRKAAQRRYPTAQALADDLVRHLDGQTVTARAPTFSYRAGKFIRRHKTGIAAAALIALALLVGIAGTTTGWRRAEIARGNEEIARIAAEKAEDAERAARNAAETRYTQLRRMFTIEDTLYEEIENLPAATAAREVLSDAMLRAIESLAVSFPDDPRLRRDLAEQYLRVGVLASKGQNSAARGVEALERALALLEDAPPADATRLRVSSNWRRRTGRRATGTRRSPPRPTRSTAARRWRTTRPPPRRSRPSTRTR
jgi:hypothetical protein